MKKVLAWLIARVIAVLETVYIKLDKEMYKAIMDESELISEKDANIWEV